MPKKSICAILRMGRRKKVEDGSKNSQNSTAQPALVAGPSAQGSKLLDPDPPINDQGQPPTAPTNVAPRPSANAADFEALPLPIPDAQPAPDHVQIARKHRAQEALPKPYASSAEMWNESQKSLSDVEKHNIEKLKGKQCKSADQDDIKAVRDQMMAGFNTRSQDDRVGYVIEKAVTILGKLLSIGDVLVSIDPLHAAPPWAFVRSVLVLLSSNSELKSRLIAGIAMVASLLAQCETYQQLYMAPDLPLRPPKESLLELKTFIVQTYAKSQQFLSFAILQQQQSTVAAPFNLGGAEDHANDLAKCEKKLIRAAEDCERHCNLSDRQNMKELLNLQADFSRAFQDQIDLILNRIDNKERIEMLEWISPIQYGRHHDRVKEDRTVDTCKWLLEHYKFREWEESSLSTILWLQGSPGAGKTFLASKVIDHELARLKSSPNQEGFAFFYCDRNEEERRKPLSVLQSYVRQLSTTARKPGCIRRQLQDFCLNARESGSDLGFSDCREQMLQSINLYSQTTLVLDALDECEPESRLKILKVIEDLLSRSESRLKIFISSRPDRDIRDRFLETPNIEIQATDNEEDIRKFVRKKITEHGHWPKMSQDLQDYIAEVLFIKSTGMFQWAFLQINELLSLETESAIRSRLGKLPTNLKTAYDEIYGKITALDEHDRALADRAFKWVACSQEPLNSEGLLSAIRLDSHTTTYNLSVTITESQLLHLCHNLLVIDTQRDVWRFSHLSVTEYFEEHHWDLRRAHSHAASVCIKFLIEAYKTVDSKKGLDVLPRINLQLSLPFGNYAHRHWIFHTRAQEGEGVDPILAQLLKSFLDSPQKTSVQYRKWFNTISRDINTYEGRDYLLKKDLKCLKDTSVALFVMCHFSFYYILQDWWERAEFDISVTNDEGYNLLILATRAGSKQICENLITRKIEVNLQLYNGEYGSALAAAVIEGQIEIVKLLVNEAGADVDMQLEYGSYGSALVAASLEGQIETVKFLVEAGANVHMQLKNGAFGSALAAAASGGKIEIVKFLINEAGANVHMQLENGGYGSALAAAAYANNLHILKFLINEVGADVDMQLENGADGSALAAAARKPEIVTTHMSAPEAGADVDMYPKNSTVRDSLEGVKFLVDAGADVNMQLPMESPDGSALAAAAYASNLRILKFLIDEAGARVDMQLQNKTFGSALAAATHGVGISPHRAIEQLLQSGADANMRLQNGKYGSALAAAAGYRGYRAFEMIEIMQLLLQAGADVNMQLGVGTYGSALLFPIEQDAHGILEFLVSAGADVNQQIRHGEFGSALAAAAFFGSKRCADILIKAGADVNLRIEHGPFRTAMQALQADIPEEIEEESEYEYGSLLKRGRGEWRRGKVEVAKLLQLHGAIDEV